MVVPHKWRAVCFAMNVKGSLQEPMGVIHPLVIFSLSKPTCGLAKSCYTVYMSRHQHFTVLNPVNEFLLFAIYRCVAHATGLSYASLFSDSKFDI